MTKRKKSLMIVLVLVILIIVAGTVFYHFVENWNWVDSFYFTTITMTTIGYGDLYPTHDVSKILTSLFAVATIPIIFFAFAVVTENYFEKRLQSLLSRESRKEIEEIERIEKNNTKEK
jgi:voltage-gated potassium channel